MNIDDSGAGSPLTVLKMTKTMMFSGLVLLLGGCSTTSLQDHWQADSFSRNDLDNVLIVAVTANNTNRFIFESEIERGMKT